MCGDRSCLPSKKSAALSVCAHRYCHSERVFWFDYYSWKEEVSRGDKSRVTCCLELPACLLQRLKVFNSHGSPPQIVIPFLLSNLFYTLRCAFKQYVSVCLCVE